MESRTWPQVADYATHAGYFVNGYWCRCRECRELIGRIPSDRLTPEATIERLRRHRLKCPITAECAFRGCRVPPGDLDEDDVCSACRAEYRSKRFRCPGCGRHFLSEEISGSVCVDCADTRDRENYDRRMEGSV